MIVITELKQFSYTEINLLITEIENSLYVYDQLKCNDTNNVLYKYKQINDFTITIYIGLWYYQTGIPVWNYDLSKWTYINMSIGTYTETFNIYDYLKKILNGSLENDLIEMRNTQQFLTEDNLRDYLNNALIVKNLWISLSLYGLKKNKLSFYCSRYILSFLDI
jgi:hypothetical protein